MRAAHLLTLALALALFAWLSLWGDEGRCWALGVLAIGAGVLVGGKLS